MKARWIALGYFAVLFLFACAYYWMPDADFYHQSIQFEPASVEHKSRLLASMGETFKIQSATGPYGTKVSSNGVSEPTFPATDTVQFSVGYYYYNLQVKPEDWSVLESRCGPSERKQPFYLRNISYRMIMSASLTGKTMTVRAETPAPSECDTAVLQLLYKSFEKTSQGFQARVPAAPDLNSLLEAVSREQLGHAPRAFPFDRFSRMLYFSVAAITTTGFGDILPLTTTARMLAAAEALSGIVLAGLFLNAIAKH